MEYIATFSLSFDAADDETAALSTRARTELIRNALRDEQTHAAHYFALEHVVAIEAVGARTLPQSHFDSRPM